MSMITNKKRLLFFVYSLLWLCVNLSAQERSEQPLADFEDQETFLSNSAQKNASGLSSDGEWELAFEEHFDGASVNQSDWYLYHSAGHAENGLRRPEAFTVADGVLTVTAQMKDGQLVSGGMGHKLNIQYGKFEARVRADDDPSLATSAVLLTWPQSERWPIDGENDFYETTTNRRKTFHTFIHYGADNKQYHKEHLFDAKEWLVVAMEWTASWIKIFVNGQLQWTLTDTNAIPHVPHHLCIQLDAFKKTMEGSVRMQVDWVKIYRQNATTTEKLLSENKSNRISPNPVVDYLNISALHDLSFQTLDVYSTEGKVIKSTKSEASRIDCSDLKSGLYFLKINAGRMSETIKFIKQ